MRKEEKKEVYLIKKNESDFSDECFLTFSSCIIVLAKIFGKNFTNDNKKELITNGFTLINDDKYSIKTLELKV